MKNKLIFSGLIAVIFIIAMIVYKDTLTLEALILIFIGAGGTITAVWKWLNAKEENAILKVMHKAEFRKNNLNLNTMTDEEIQVILDQVQYIDNNLSATHPAKQVAEETIENLKSFIGGGGVLNPPPS